MASSQGAKIRRTYIPFSQDITVNSVRMASQDITSWKRAIDTARSELNPRRKMLYELYDNIVIDGHLMSVMEKRKMGITNKKVNFLADENTDIQAIQQLIVNAPWFFKFLRYSAEAKPYGHSLIELIPNKDGSAIIDDSVLIDRANVIPERSFVAYSHNNLNEGIFYAGEKADAAYSPFLIEVGGKKDYGLLMTAAQYVIYKRGGFGDWAQFAELFGMPFRVGKYNPYDDATRRKLDTALNTMGGAGYAIIPDGTSLEFHDNNGTGKSEIFKDIIETANSEISKIFLGQTMTTENGSSRSQSQVHKDVEEEVNMNDMIEMEYLLNWDFKDKIRNLSGLNVLDKGRFQFQETTIIPLEKRIEIDMKLADKIDMSEEYFYKTYGVDKPVKGDKIIIKSTAPALPAEKKKLTLKRDNCCVTDYTSLSSKINESDLSAEENALIDAIYNEQGVKIDYATFEKNISKLREGLLKGIGTGAVDYGSDNNTTATMMELNLNRFGFNKNISQITELNKALNEKETFADFKKKAVSILGNYNTNYLETEYNFAIAAGQNAAAWNKQLAEKEMYPYLKYETLKDAHVRQAHAALEGKIFRIDDKSWRGIYPPNGYGCRCEMTQIRKDELDGDLTTGAEAKGLLGEEWTKMQKGGFDVNRGETKEIFAANDAYLQKIVGKSDITIKNVNYKDYKLAEVKDMKGLKEIPTSNKTPEDIRELFNTKHKVINGEKILMYTDYNGRKLGLSEKQLFKHLEGDYINDVNQRDKLFDRIFDTLKKPHEVWQQIHTGEHQYKYITYYNNATIAVDVHIKNERMEIKTWYKALKNDSELRSGILIKKK